MIEAIVTDDGPGIDVTMTDKIFDQFQTNKEHGMGIGLSLSRSIIEAHGVIYGQIKIIPIVLYSVSNFLLASEYMDGKQADTCERFTG